MGSILSFENIEKFYLIFVGIVAGASLFAGAVVASVIFNANEFLTDLIMSRYQMGTLMSEVFHRLSFIVAGLVTFILLLELHSFFRIEKCGSLLILSLIAVVTGALFSFYFVPEILTLQALGEDATTSDAFFSLHKNSEFVFKVFTFSLLGIMGMRLFKKREQKA